MMQDVVWERLCAVNGDTDFVRDDFSSFAERSRAAQAQDAARLAQEAFSSVLPSQGEHLLRICAGRSSHLLSRVRL